MKRRTLFNLLMVLGLVLALGSTVALARQPRAQGPVIQGPLSPQDDLGTSFTYQGRLIFDGTPVDGTCSFGVSLYGSPGGPDQIGTPQDKLGVSVSDGYFTLQNLDFGAAAFTGEARYLEIAVDCGSGGILLTPRVALTAAPYAHSLRPGASVQSSSSNALNLSTGATTGAALSASASATTGDAAAVYGASSSPSGAGVSGYNATSGYGVYGGTAGSTGIPYGVYGLASHAGSATSYGVYGKSNSSVGTGVGGEAPTNGVYGEATNSSGTTYGVYGKSNSSAGYAVYADGRAYVEDELYVNAELQSDGDFHALSNAEVDGDLTVHGSLTWDTKTSYIAVSTAAFVPELLNDGGHVEYDNEGYYLQNESSSTEWFMAQVQLPHGATVTELSVGWGDGSDEGGTVYLKRRSMIEVGQVAATMAQVSSVGTLGLYQEGVWSDDTIDLATVQNDSFTYFLEVYLPATSQDVQLYGVVIEYQITQPY
jgi:hypothetical protein